MTTCVRVVLAVGCGSLLLLTGCGGPGDEPAPSASLPATAPSTVAPPSGNSSPRSWPGRPTTVAVPNRTSAERARTVVSRGDTRISIADSTARARHRDAWVLRGACAVPAGQLGPGSLVWTVGWAVPHTTDFHVVASGRLTCGAPEQDVVLPALRGRPVQINVDSPDDVTSAYVLVVPST